MATTDYFNISMPDPEETPGPEWAQGINEAISALSEVVALGAIGMQISNEFINITENLDLNGFNLVEAGSVELEAQGSTLASSGSIYRVGGDLYYNNGAGTPVQITSGTALSATSLGGITGMTGTPASVDYDGIDTFFFEQDVNTPAAMSLGPTRIRRPVSAGAGVTLEVSNSITSDYTLLIPPAPPVATAFLTMNGSGELAYSPPVNGGITASFLGTSSVEESKIASFAVTNNKIGTGAVTDSKLASNAVIEAKIANNAVTTNKINDLAVTTGKINNLAVTRAKLAALGQVNSGTVDFTHGGTAVWEISAASAVVLVCSGRPMTIVCKPVDGQSGYFQDISWPSAQTYGVRITVTGSATQTIGETEWDGVFSVTKRAPGVLSVPFYNPGAGTYTFRIETFLVNCIKLQLVAWEL